MVVDIPLNWRYTEAGENTGREVSHMNQRQIGIADMQCWVFRKAQKKWNMPPKKCTELFRKYDLLGFISECYELLHVSSYQCALAEGKRSCKARGSLYRIPDESERYGNIS